MKCSVFHFNKSWFWTLQCSTLCFVIFMDLWKPSLSSKLLYLEWNAQFSIFNKNWFWTYQFWTMCFLNLLGITNRTWFPWGTHIAPNTYPNWALLSPEGLPSSGHNPRHPGFCLGLTLNGIRSCPDLILTP